ncbi:MAG: TolC family protein, partial [Gammaproteobacteria bacterium]
MLSKTITTQQFIHSIWITIIFSLLTVNSALAVDIEGIYELAQRTDHVIRKAEAIRAGSQEVVEQSSARFWPKISASTFYSQISQERTVHDITNTSLLSSDVEYASNGYSINVTQPLFDYDAIVNNKQAWAQYELADITYNETDHHLLLRVITTYIGVSAAKKEIRHRETEAKNLKKELERTEHLLDLGISAKIDVSEAKA